MFLGKKSSKSSTKMVSKFHALGDPNRYKIMGILSKNEDICVSEVADKVGISTAGVSQHMRILEDAGLIKKRRLGQKICYEVDEGSKENSEILEIVTGK